MLRAWILVQASLANVVPTDQLHCLLLDLIATEAADMQVQFVEHVVVEGGVLAQQPFQSRLFNGVLHDHSVFIRSQIWQLLVAHFEFV